MSRPSPTLHWLVVGVLAAVLAGNSIAVPAGGASLRPASSAPLSANITIDDQGGSWNCAQGSETIAFFGHGFGGVVPYQYLWSFGDGTPSSTAQDPIHVYHALASFNATLTVIDAMNSTVSAARTVEWGIPLVCSSPAPNVGGVVLYGVLIVGVAGGGFLVLRSRRQRPPEPPGPPSWGQTVSIGASLPPAPSTGWPGGVQAMPHTTSHSEKHFRSPAAIRDIVIGMSDGLTVPFALAAGLSGVFDTSNIVVTAGLAEIVAGSISMGLGGYLAAKSDADHYHSERRREEREITEFPEVEVQEVAEILTNYGLEPAKAKEVAETFRQRPKQWVDFMMRYELDLSAPDRKRLVVSPLTIGGAYAAGGIIPLIPYVLVNSVHVALPYSVVATVIALGAFGAIKGHYTGVSWVTSAIQTILVGGVAALAAFALARLIVG